MSNGGKSMEIQFLGHFFHHFFWHFHVGWKPTKKLSPRGQSDWTLVLEFSWRKSCTTFRAKDYNISLPSIPRNQVFLHSFVSKTKNIVVSRKFSFEVLKIFISNDFWRKLKTVWSSQAQAPRKTTKQPWNSVFLPEISEKCWGKPHSGWPFLSQWWVFQKLSPQLCWILRTGTFNSWSKGSCAKISLSWSDPSAIVPGMVSFQSSYVLGLSKVGGVCTEVVFETLIFGTSTVL